MFTMTTTPSLERWNPRALEFSTWENGISLITKERKEKIAIKYQTKKQFSSGFSYNFNFLFYVPYQIFVYYFHRPLLLFPHKKSSYTRIKTAGKFWSKIKVQFWILEIFWWGKNIFKCVVFFFNSYILTYAYHF